MIMKTRDVSNTVVERIEIVEHFKEGND